MKTILFPTDFSDNAHQALRFAIPFAQRIKARLILLHVYPYPAVYAEAPMAIMDRETGLLRVAAQEQLLSLAEEVHQLAPEIECETFTRQGPVTSQILSVAQEHQADGIFMGTQGKTSLEKIIFGSVTAQVIAQAECPVLGIPSVEVFQEIRRIVYATDYQEGDFQALKQIADIARLFDAEIIVLHIATEMHAAEATHFATHAEALRQAVSYPKLQFHLLQHPNLQDGLEEFIDRFSADLLAMCSKKRSLFGQLIHSSQTKKMAYHTKKPLLALHH